MKALLIAALDEAYDHRSWHGTNLKGSVRGLPLDVASWRPAASRHNIWETLVHAAYWKYVVRRRLQDEPRGSFPLAGSNWWRRPEAATSAAWRADVALLESQHRALLAAVRALPTSRLSRRIPRSPFTYAALVRGAAAHDLYHAGQIQLLKRLATGPRRARSLHR